MRSFSKLIIGPLLTLSVLTSAVTTNLHYNATVRTLVNDEQKIALVRVDQNGKGVNEAFAWQDGVPLEQMKRVIYMKNKTTDTFMWIQTDTNGVVVNNDNSVNEWINGNWNIISFQA